jgi:hypothetical protein
MIKGNPAEIQTGYVLNREQVVTATCSVPEKKLGGKKVRFRTGGARVDLLKMSRVTLETCKRF